MKSLSSSLFGGALGAGGEDEAQEGPTQTGKSIQQYKGPGSFASQSGGNFTSAGKALGVRNDMISAPGRFKGLLFEGVDPSNPWSQ